MIPRLLFHLHTPHDHEAPFDTSFCLICVHLFIKSGITVTVWFFNSHHTMLHLCTVLGTQSVELLAINILEPPTVLCSSFCKMGIQDLLHLCRNAWRIFSSCQDRCCWQLWVPMRGPPYITKPINVTVHVRVVMSLATHLQDMPDCAHRSTHGLRLRAMLCESNANFGLFHLWKYYQ